MTTLAQFAAQQQQRLDAINANRHTEDAKTRIELRERLAELGFTADDGWLFENSGPSVIITHPELPSPATVYFNTSDKLSMITWNRIYIQLHRAEELLDAMNDGAHLRKETDEQ